MNKKRKIQKLKEGIEKVAASIEPWETLLEVPVTHNEPMKTPLDPEDEIERTKDMIEVWNPADVSCDAGNIEPSTRPEARESDEPPRLSPHWQRPGDLLPPVDKTSVFISYSHEDRKWKERLVQQLHAVKIDLWDDQHIGAGTEWLEAVKQAITNATIAVLLVSPDFLSSEFVQREEIPRLLARREADGLKIIPIIVRASVWKQLQWLSKMQARLIDGKPLAAVPRYKWEAGLVEIAEEILSISESERPRQR